MKLSYLEWAVRSTNVSRSFVIHLKGTFADARLVIQALSLHGYKTEVGWFFFCLPIKLCFIGMRSNYIA